MVDPAAAWTIGMIASKALTIGAKAALDSAVGEAAKDTYKNLRDWLLRKAGATSKAAIDDPNSLERTAPLARDIDNLPDDEKAELRRLIDDFNKKLSSDHEARRTYGAEIGELEEETIKLTEIEASGNATGIKIGKAKGKTFSLSKVKATGTPSGKGAR
jgi:hypothetical protein